MTNFCYKTNLLEQKSQKNLYRILVHVKSQTYNDYQYHNLLLLQIKYILMTFSSGTKVHILLYIYAKNTPKTKNPLESAFLSRRRYDRKVTNTFLLTTDLILDQKIKHTF